MFFLFQAVEVCNRRVAHLFIPSFKSQTRFIFTLHHCLSYR